MLNRRRFVGLTAAAIAAPPITAPPSSGSPWPSQSLSISPATSTAGCRIPIKFPPPGTTTKTRTERVIASPYLSPACGER